MRFGSVVLSVMVNFIVFFQVFAAQTSNMEFQVKEKVITRMVWNRLVSAAEYLFID